MFDDLLAANRHYVSDFGLASLDAPAAKHFALLTCMDSRIEPLAMLGLRAGDAKILRNAGGRATPDALRSLVLAATFLGVEQVAVMHHTECAMANNSDAAIRDQLTAEQQAGTEGWEFLAMPDPDAALAADVQTVRSCAGLPKGVQVEGWRYDVRTGEVRRVVPAG